jgi:hypothetical protein
VKGLPVSPEHLPSGVLGWHRLPPASVTPSSDPGKSPAPPLLVVLVFRMHAFVYHAPGQGMLASSLARFSPMIVAVAIGRAT